MEETKTAFEAGKVVGGVLACGFMVLIPVLFILSLILAIVKKSKPWTVVAVICGLLGLGFLGLMAFGAIAGFTEAAKAATASKTVPCSEGFFEVDVPGHWAAQNLEVPDATLKYGNLLREEYFVVIPEPKSDFDKDFGVEDFAELASEGTGSNMTNGKVGAITPVAGGNLPALRCEITGSVDGIKLVYLNTYLEGKDRFYQVIAWTLPLKRATALPLFEKVADSLRELPQAEAPQ